MGRYSLENYEQYKTHKIRPVSLQIHPNNWGRGKFTPLYASWEEIEPKRGQFEFSSIEKALEDMDNPLLHLDLSPPQWVKEDLDCFHTSLIIKLGSVFDGGQLIGIAIDSNKYSKIEMDAFQLAFQNTPLIIRLEDEIAQEYFNKRGQKFGLMVQCSQKTILDCRERFARQGLQHLWKTSPVILLAEDMASDGPIYEEARRWHAAFSNGNMDVGFNISLRKLAYLKEISSGGAFPLRFWFVNTGTAPCYLKLSLRLRLSRQDDA